MVNDFWSLWNVLQASGALDNLGAKPDHTPAAKVDPDLVQLLQQHDLSNTSVYMVLEQIPT